MRRLQQPSRTCRSAGGFTLAELTVVLVIVALLFASAFVPLSTQLEVRNITDTRKQIEDIKEALIGFALSQGRLPCPADPTIASGSANAGIERAACSGNTLTGVVPWATLGLREGDAWGRRFTYRVTETFADSIAASTHGCTPAPNPLPTMSSYALCTEGDMTVNTRDTTSKLTSVIANKVPAVIISHGRNGYGASQPTAVYMPDPPATNADEATNKTAGTIDFISRDRTDDSTGCSDTLATGTPLCEFDDIVAWVPLTTLIARTAAAGKLP